MRRAKILSASARASALRSSRFSCDGVGVGGSRRARVSCIATLLIGRRRLLWNQAATEESVHDPSGVEKICQRCETRFTPRQRTVVVSPRPVCPTGGNERAAAVRQHYE